MSAQVVTTEGGLEVITAPPPLDAIVSAYEPPILSVDAGDVLARWKTSGPLVHEGTGLAELDRLTGGGPVYGSRWYLLGAPDAGKTALLVQLAHGWAERGIAVGLLAVDEEDDDITTRLAQRSGFTRRECEERNPHVVERMAERLRALPLRMYGGAIPIEEAARDLAAFMKEKGIAKGALFVDSIQAVTCAALAAGGKESPREVITANVRALRATGTKHGLITVATSEMNRNAYRSVESAEKADDMAAAAESRAVEYSARVMLSLRSVKDHPQLTQVRMVKNKHGASYPAAPDFFLRLDRATQTIEGADAPVADPTAGTEAPKFVGECAAVHQIVIDNPGTGGDRLRNLVAARNLKMGHPKLAGILTRLIEDGKIECKQARPPNGGKLGDVYYPLVTMPVGTVKKTSPRTNGIETDDALLQDWMDGTA